MLEARELEIGVGCNVVNLERSFVGHDQRVVMLRRDLRQLLQ